MWRVVLGVLVLAIAPAHGVQAAPSGAVHPTVLTHGLRITLHVGRRSYPRNAVVAVTLSIRNTTRRAISIMSGLNAPEVMVLNTSGEEVYDPFAPLGNLTLISQMGPGPVSFDLHPGRTSTFYNYVVLQGNTLATTVILGNARHIGAEVTVAGPRLRLHLTKEAPPSVVVSASSPQARLIPPSPMSGPAIAYSQERCGDLSTSEGWATGNGDVVSPETPDTCTTYTWHAIAGWLNHPVATIVYPSAPGSARSRRS